MQLFMIDFLTQLVMSQLPSESELDSTLQPMKSFLAEHIKSLRHWLCPENYFAFLDRLWLSLSWVSGSVFGKSINFRLLDKADKYTSFTLSKHPFRYLNIRSRLR